MPIFQTTPLSETLKSSFEAASTAEDLDAKRMANKATQGIMDKFADDPTTRFIAMHPEAAIGLQNAIIYNAMKPIADKIARQSTGGSNPILQQQSQDLANGGTSYDANIQGLRDLGKIKVAISDPYKEQEIANQTMTAEATAKNANLRPQVELTTGFGATAPGIGNSPQTNLPANNINQPTMEGDGTNMPANVDSSNFLTTEPQQGQQMAENQIQSQDQGQPQQPQDISNLPPALTPQETIAMKAGEPINGKDLSAGYEVSANGVPVIKNALAVTSKRQLQTFVDAGRDVSEWAHENGISSTEGISKNNITNAIRAGDFGDDVAKALNDVFRDKPANYKLSLEQIRDMAIGATRNAEGMASGSPRAVSFYQTMQDAWPTSTVDYKQQQKMFDKISNILGIGSIPNVYPELTRTYSKEIKSEQDKQANWALKQANIEQSSHQEGDTFTNPKTKERLIYKDGLYIPYQK